MNQRQAHAVATNMGVDYLENLMDEATAAGRYRDYGCDEVELAYLARIASAPRIKLIAEIGFNYGLSSYTFLEANPGSLVCSFDLAEFSYTAPAKQYIDDVFAGRHTLVQGNSMHTVPAFFRMNASLRFDLIFIDGGHSYEIARADLLNMRSLATRDTILVMDDITPWKPCGVGPTQAWLEAVEAGLISHHELLTEGRPAFKIEPPGNRSWAIGRYNL
jgi:predicted O-methyltransferase YrrM